MNASPILIPEAKADVADAYMWYEDQSLGLGMDFLRCVEVALLSIQRTPMIYPVVHEAYRRALVRRFPFAIFFEIDDANDRCVVYSVFHCSQNPEKWRERFPQ
jgi:plasmid stabilization system protein ParE